MHSRPWPNAVRLCLMFLAAGMAVTPLFAQGDPAVLMADYGVPHLFGLPTATTTRLFGMGGITACVPDAGFANPAFAGSLTGPNAGMRYSLTEFDYGLKLKGFQAWYNTPLGSKDGIQVVGFWLDSDTGGVMAFGGMANADLYEGDISLHYGRQVAEGLTVGIGLSPVMSSFTKVYNPVGGAMVFRLDSRVGFGARVGAAYQPNADTCVGLIFDSYTEDVTFTGIEGPALAVQFDAMEYALGVSHRPIPSLLLAAEWGELRNKANTVENIFSAWRFGAEYNVNSRARVRVGSNDGQLSAGFGYDGGSWAASYAYINDWNDEMVGAVLGGSDTQQIEITSSW